jgi:hypothetical protein
MGKPDLQRGDSEQPGLGRQPTVNLRHKIEIADLRHIAGPGPDRAAFLASNKVEALWLGSR